METTDILKQLDQDRKDGFRPSIMLIFTHEKKILVFFAKEYQQWVFPQAGVENSENFENALIRLINDEVGAYVIEKLGDPLVLVGEKKSTFPNRIQGSKDLRTDDGAEVMMVGKKYYIFTASLTDQRIDISKSVFGDFFWLTEKEARFIFTNMLYVNKKEVFLFALDSLKQKGIIA